jgi:hypothetical protein
MLSYNLSTITLLTNEVVLKLYAMLLVLVLAKQDNHTKAEEPLPKLDIARFAIPPSSYYSGYSFLTSMLLCVWAMENNLLATASYEAKRLHLIDSMVGFNTADLQAEAISSYSGDYSNYDLSYTLVDLVDA